MCAANIISAWKKQFSDRPQSRYLEISDFDWMVENEHK